MKSTVKGVMTTRVIFVRKDASFREMAATLREHRVSAFPVLDDDRKVIGVVSEADLLTKQALDSGEDGMPGMITGLLRHREQEKARGITAGDLMTSPPVTVRPEETVEHAARLMYTHRAKRLPVVNAAGRLVGIISRADVLVVSDPQALTHLGALVRLAARGHAGPGSNRRRIGWLVTRAIRS